MCAHCGLRRCPLVLSSVNRYGIDNMCFCNVSPMIVDRLRKESGEDTRYVR